jgi:hypothetical protein
MANRALTSQMISRRQQIKKLQPCTALCIFIRSVAHSAGGRFALAAARPAVQQKLCAAAVEIAFNGASAVGFQNKEFAPIHANKTPIRF